MNLKYDSWLHYDLCLKQPFCWLILKAVKSNFGWSCYISVYIKLLVDCGWATVTLLTRPGCVRTARTPGACFRTRLGSVQDAQSLGAFRSTRPGRVWTHAPWACSHLSKQVGKFTGCLNFHFFNKITQFSKIRINCNKKHKIQ